MKYIDIVIMILGINLVLALFAQIGIGGTAFNVQSIEAVNSSGNSLDPDSMGYKTRVFSTDTSNIYNNAGASDPNQVYLQSGGDFLRGLLWFSDLFASGTVMVGSTLRNFGIPAELIWFFVTPIYLIYALAFIQLVSGRAFEGNT